MVEKIPIQTNERDDCAYLLARSRTLIDETRATFFWVTSLGLVAALLAVATNLGAVEITKFKIGEIEISLNNLFLLRLFLTSASLGALVVLSYLNKRFESAEKMIDYLAEEHKYDKALIATGFETWLKNTPDYKSFASLSRIMGVSLFFLLAVLPVCAFVVSFFRS